jgi:glycosyltransferase involved in cell wall biosynthesis
MVAVLSRATGRRGAVMDRMPVRNLSRTLVLARRLGQAAPLDAVVAMGTEMYDLAAVVPAGLPCATYDDGTLQQMWNHSGSDIRSCGFPPRHVRRWIRRQSDSSRAASVCCVSTHWAARSFADDYAIPRDRIAVVGMGHRPRSAAPSGKDWSRPTFLFVGVDWKRKNGARVLEAFSRVRERVPAATLHVVGEHPHIDAPGVIDHGFLPKDNAASQELLDRLYAAATCFVLPSRFDPSPISYLEAASAGIPVIATPFGGAGELLGRGALTVDPSDTGSIAEAMVRLSAPQQARAMGEAAAQVAATASWTNVAGRILDALAAAAPATGSGTVSGGSRAARPS